MQAAEDGAQQPAAQRGVRDWLLRRPHPPPPQRQRAALEAEARADAAASAGHGLMVRPCTYPQGKLPLAPRSLHVRHGLDPNEVDGVTLTLILRDAATSRPVSGPDPQVDLNPGPNPQRPGFKPALACSGPSRCLDVRQLTAWLFY